MRRNPWRSPKPSTPEGVAEVADGDEPEVAASDDAADELAALTRDPRVAVRRSAMDILARREHSVAELRAKLRSRDYADPDIDAVLDDLTRERLLSEDRFVENFIGSYTRRGQGPVWLRAELERRGIDGPVIAAALQATATDWAAEATAVRRKRFGAVPPVDFRDRASQARFLQYRGFTAEQVQAALGGSLADDD